MKNLISKYRKLRGYTQKYMAEELCVSRRTYVNYELSITEPTLDILVHISKILRIPIDDLLDNEKYPSQRDTVKESLIRDIENVLKHYK